MIKVKYKTVTETRKIETELCNICGNEMTMLSGISYDDDVRGSGNGITVEGFDKYSEDLHFCYDCLRGRKMKTACASDKESKDLGNNLAKFRAYILAYFNQEKK